MKQKLVKSMKDRTKKLFSNHFPKPFLHGLYRWAYANYYVGHITCKWCKSALED